MKPKVYVIDDDVMVNKAVRWLVESVGYQVETYTNPNTFLENYHPAEPCCLVLDIRMPDISGLKLQAILQEREIDIPIIFITGHGDVPMAVDAMKNGASDFLTKPLNNQKLLDAINKAISQDMEQKAEQQRCTEILEKIKRLTPREYQVMECMVAGNVTKTIARALNISPNTVDVHRAKVLKKMECDTLSTLISLVLKTGIVSVPA